MHFCLLLGHNFRVMAEFLHKATITTTINTSAFIQLVKSSAVTLGLGAAGDFTGHMPFLSRQQQRQSTDAH